ncbi:MAG: sulfatase [Bryobacterales bacterium]|nr:sulfatase [Bryobacterales bacterium]
MFLSRRAFVSALAGARLAASAQSRRKPNLVLILIDDYGWTDTGYNGSTYYQTPHIDTLARSGMVFTNGYAAAPVCSPTRSAIMTGKYPARLHLTSHLQGASNRFHFTKVLQPSARLELPLEEVTIAELLKAEGYRTACIGKWHLGKTGFQPQDQGFDIAHAGDEAGSTNNFFYPEWKKKVPLEGKDGDYLTDRLTDLAVDFIGAHKDRPFFLYLPHFAVHTPIQGKPDKVRKYDALAKPDNPQNYGEYAAMIESVDESVGRVMAALRQHGLDDNTLVLFSSDNGGVTSLEWKKRPVTSNLPLRLGKGHLYEGGIRVPTIARWTGVIQPGSRCDEPVVSYDYAPTFAEVAGVDKSKTARMDGRSLAPLFKRGTLGKRDNFWHYPHYSPQLGKPSAAIRNGDDKLILFFEDRHVELYNLREDIGEKKDLAALQPEKAAALRGRLEAWLRQTKAQLPRPNPNHDPARERQPGEPDGPTTAK